MRSSPRLHAVIAALPLAVWTVFHLWEQWPAFQGREAWLARVRGTSQGPLAITIEIVAVVLPLAMWSALALADVARRTPLPGCARDGDTGLARVVGALAPFGTVLAILFLVIHVGHLWGPKIVRGASDLETWTALTHDLGRPWMLVLYAIGLSAIAAHLAGAIPAALEAMGWIQAGESRRSALLVSSVFALCAWVLAVQLTGWLAIGRGTFWSVDVIEVPGEMPEDDLTAADR